MTKRQLNDFPFFEHLKEFYIHNKSRIRNRYRTITKKFIDYNDSEKNPDSYLRKPQFEALELYVFLKEFMNNKQMYKIFAEWFNKKGVFSDRRYTLTDHQGQISFYEQAAELNYNNIFEFMKENAESYPNYIFALAMGIGKTKLIATCIFYEFLLADKFPSDARYVHNALVFAPDKTVLGSLNDIQTFDKNLVVPPEYVSKLDMNVKFHYLDDTSTTLNIIDGSSFNIVISNNQKIIIKKKHKKDKPANELMNLGHQTSFQDDELSDFLDETHKEAFEQLKEKAIEPNQRYQKLTRLKQLGIYVDEAHHLFGNKLLKDLKKDNTTSLRYTINQLSKQLEQRGSHIVACYNYTGTPYVNNLLLPEVVYYYGLDEAISHEYLKEIKVSSYGNVKNEDFINSVVETFFTEHSTKETYEGLPPKIAIYGATVDEIINVIKPLVEKKLLELDIPLNKILVNVGDTKYTKDIDERDFKNLDVPSTEGSQKQVILLVNKGKEGWDCRSLFSVALFRSPKSKVFVLQSTMRALRQISDIQQKAHIFLSEDNYEILNDELEKNYKIDTVTLQKSNPNKKKSKVRVCPRLPMKKIKINEVKYNYTLFDRSPNNPIDFNLGNINLDNFKSTRTIKEDMMDYRLGKTEEFIVEHDYKYSKLTLVAEMARYLNFSPVKIQKLLEDSVDSIDKILKLINKYPSLLYKEIIPKVFNYYYEVKEEIESQTKEVDLLNLPKGQDYLEYSVEEGKLIKFNDTQVIKFNAKSFHTDKYCFDSHPEKQFFLEFLKKESIMEIYFTGMFTSSYNNVAIQYIDPETYAVRKYYPDFIVVYANGSYELTEIKADFQLDNKVVKAKKQAAEQITKDSNMTYKIRKSSDYQ